MYKRVCFLCFIEPVIFAFWDVTLIAVGIFGSEDAYFQCKHARILSNVVRSQC